MDENLKNIQKLAKMLDGHQMVTVEDFKSAVSDFINAFAQHRSAFKELSTKNEESINTTLKNLQGEFEKIRTDVSRETGMTKEEMKSMMAKCVSDMKDMCDEMESRLPEDGKDGMDADEERIIQEVLAKIKLPEEKLEETPNEEIDKINLATNQIKKERVEGLEQAIMNSATNAVQSMPVTTMFVNGKRSKNLNFSGLTVNTAGDTTTVTASAGSGTVTDVSVTTANGVSGSVATSTTTPAITLTLGAITPSSVAAVGTVTGSNLSNTNTGDQTSIVGISGTMAQFDTAVSDGNLVFQSGALGTPSSGTLTNATGLPVAGITASTTQALGVGSVELGHASDTTLSRASAGVLAVEGVNVLTVAGGTLTGSITLGENTGIALDPAGSADGKWSGITIAGTAGYAQAFGELNYLASADSRWELADADAATTADRLLAMVVSAGAADGSACVMLLIGQIRADAKFPALTIGSAVYVGETAGAIQTAIPTGADNVIRRVGYALTADEIYFNPSMDSQTTVA